MVALKIIKLWQYWYLPQSATPPFMVCGYLSVNSLSTFIEEPWWWWHSILKHVQLWDTWISYTHTNLRKKMWSRSSRAHSSWFSDMHEYQPKGKSMCRFLYVTDSLVTTFPKYWNSSEWEKTCIPFKPPLKWRLRSGCRERRKSLNNHAVVAADPKEMPSHKRRRGIEADESSSAPADGFEVGASSRSSMPQQSSAGLWELVDVEKAVEGQSPAVPEPAVEDKEALPTSIADNILTQQTVYFYSLKRRNSSTPLKMNPQHWHRSTTKLKPWNKQTAQAQDTLWCQSSPEVGTPTKVPKTLHSPCNWQKKTWMLGLGSTAAVLRYKDLHSKGLH